jgi:hypothetical protein
MRHPPSEAAVGRCSAVGFSALRPVSAFPEGVIGVACASSFSRLARRSLALQPAHSRFTKFVTHIRMLQPFGYFLISALLLSGEASAG